jgi:hypothetical protein
MEFNDVKLFTWLKYQDEYWFVTNLDKTYCSIENKSGYYTALTIDDFSNTLIEPVQLPTFQLNESVLYTSPQGDQHIVTIETIDYNDSLTYRIKYHNEYAWVRPFMLQKLQY